MKSGQKRNSFLSINLYPVIQCCGDGVRAGVRKRCKRNKINKTRRRLSPEGRTRAGVTRGGVHGMLSPLPQVYVDAETRCDVLTRGRAVTRKRNHGFADCCNECSMAEVGSNGESDGETQREEEGDRELGRSCLETQVNERGEIGTQCGVLCD